MKKLNKKGFTLIELLAVIVILAIIVVVTVPTILNSIDDARKSAINSLAKEIANWYDTSYAQDMLAIGNDKILGDIHLDHSTGNTGVMCLKDIDGNYVNTKPGDLKNLAELYGLSEDDILLDGFYSFTFEDGTSGNTCSHIKLKDGKAVVVLIGKEGGKFGKSISNESMTNNNNNRSSYLTATRTIEIK